MVARMRSLRGGCWRVTLAVGAGAGARTGEGSATTSPASVAAVASGASTTGGAAVIVDCDMARERKVARPSNASAMQKSRRKISSATQRNAIPSGPPSHRKTNTENGASEARMEDDWHSLTRMRRN